MPTPRKADDEIAVMWLNDVLVKIIAHKVQMHPRAVLKVARRLNLPLRRAPVRTDRIDQR